MFLWFIEGVSVGHFIKKISCRAWKQALLASLILSLFHSCPLPLSCCSGASITAGHICPCNHLQHFHFGKQTQKTLQQHYWQITEPFHLDFFFQYCLDATYYIFPELRSWPAERKTALLWLWHTRSGWICWRGWELQSWLFPRSPGVPQLRGRLGRRVLSSAGPGWQPAHTRHGKKETFTGLQVVGSVSSTWEGTENCWIDTAEKERRVALLLFSVSHSGGLIFSNFDLVY